jgi:hypothetical protein
MPELIEDTSFDLDDETVRKNLLSRLLDKSSMELVGTYKGLNFYVTGRNSNGGYWFLLDKTGSDLAYVCRFVTLGASSMQFKSKVITQVAVWRNFDVYVSRAFPAYIFFRMLLPKYGVVMTDNQQTKDGRRFWQARMGDALHKGLFVYTFDQNTRDLHRLHNTDDIDDAAPYLWKKDPKFRTRRVLISQTKLTLN